MITLTLLGCFIERCKGKIQISPIPVDAFMHRRRCLVEALAWIDAHVDMGLVSPGRRLHRREFHA